MVEKISLELIIFLTTDIGNNSTVSISSSWGKRSAKSSWVSCNWKIAGNMGRRLGETINELSGVNLDSSNICTPVSYLNSRRAPSSMVSLFTITPEGSSHIAWPRGYRNTLQRTIPVWLTTGRIMTCGEWYSTTWKSSFSNNLKWEVRWISFAFRLQFM